MRKFIVTSTVVLLAVLFLPFGRIASAALLTCDEEPTEMNIAYGDSVDCDFFSGGDIDVYRFWAEVGDQLSISVQVAGYSGCLRLFDPDGDEIGTETCALANYLEPPAIAKAGTHTILTREIGGRAIPYTLQLTCIFGPGGCPVILPPPLSGYTAVAPCRIVDTRFGTGGTFAAGETRDYHVYGDVSAQNGAGGNAPVDHPTDCPSPVGEPSAVHMNVTVLPRNATGQTGFATVWPWDTVRPSASWINYQGGNLNIANAGTAQTTVSTETDPDISVYAYRDIELIIDVMGYYSD